MDEEKRLPFSGVSCDIKEKECKIWWLATIEGKTHTVEVKMPIELKTREEERKKEIELEDLLNSSEAIL